MVSTSWQKIEFLSTARNLLGIKPSIINPIHVALQLLSEYLVLATGLQKKKKYGKRKEII
jgi:hypothetical protein